MFTKYSGLGHIENLQLSVHNSKILVGILIIYPKFLKEYRQLGIRRNRIRKFLDRDYLMAPWTRGFLKNLEKRAVTSSISLARSVNASTFVVHFAILLLSNL